tara:strand:+ start:1230 stop:1982 length:753 start_codon:yes stop_codon:yes gene_type:complete
MFRNRLIPLLLIDRECRLIKTVGFDQRTYIGDPLNVIRLFNEMEVDEICLVSIDVDGINNTIPFSFLEEFSSECFMPLSYGGGIRSIDDCKKLNRIGIEKVILRSLLNSPDEIKILIRELGSQFLIGCLDYSVKNNMISFPKKGTGNFNERLKNAANAIEDLGIGEMILQSIDLDGNRNGYDLERIELISKELSIPLIALGGAGSYLDLKQALDRGASAVASGSTFSFTGALRAVLINYPEEDEFNSISI